MANFHEIRFPDDISRGSAGGPIRRTDIIELVSGFEERNASMAHSRRTYDAGMGLRNVNHLHEVIEFWEARFGQLYGFRWKDWADYKSCRTATNISFLDQNIGTGDGIKTQFQLVKNYISGGFSYVRDIKKPVANTVIIGKANILQSSGFTINNTTGIVTFSTPPSPGQQITAGFEFDVPVRFDEDRLLISIDAFNHGSIPTINIKEIRV